MKFRKVQFQAGAAFAAKPALLSPPSRRLWLKNVARHPPPRATKAFTRSAVLP
jgi:hypothetical protein